MATFKQLLQDLRNSHENRDNQTFYETLTRLEQQFGHLPNSLVAGRLCGKCGSSGVDYDRDCRCDACNGTGVLRK